MKIALIQMNAKENKAENIAKAASFVTTAVKNGAEFVLLPEVFNYRGVTEKRFLLENVAEKIPGPSLEPLIKIAKNQRAYILAGTLYEKDAARNAVYNTSVFIDKQGKVAARYRKRNLFKAQIGHKKVDEEKYLTPGKNRKIIHVGDMKAGMSICYDLRFPALYQFYAQRGCHLLVVPAAFTQKTGRDHWEALLRARAIETQSYVLAPNQVGKGAQGVCSYGHSMVIDPWGNVLIKGSAKKEQIIYCDIFKQQVRKIRRLLPMNHRKER